MTLNESRQFLSSDIALRQIVIDAAKLLQAKGRLRDDLDCATFGAALFNNANALFLEFTWTEEQTFEQLNALIAEQTDAIVTLALPPRAGQ